MTTAVGPVLESLVNQEHFNESEFVERLTKKLVYLQQLEFQGGTKKTNLSNAEFNPESFLKTFSSALDGLHKLAEKLDKKIEGLEAETSEAERTHKVKLTLFQDTFEQNFKHFSELDSRISKVGSAAVTVGERLETDDTQRERALQVKELMEYYLHLNTLSNDTNASDNNNQKKEDGHISDLSDVDDEEPESPKPSHLSRLQEGNVYAKTLLKDFLEFNTHRDRYKIKKYNYKYTQTVLSHNMDATDSNNSDVFQEGVGFGKANPTNPMNIVYVFDSDKTQQFYEKCIIAKKLLSISQELDIDRLQKAKDNIFTICSELEKQILGEFKTAYKEYNVKKMKECSIILYEFNGGDSCVGHYIERYIHPSPQLLQDDVDIARRVSDITVALETGTMLEDPRIAEFFDDIVKTCEDEFKTVNRVFPNPTKVMAMLVQQLAKNRIKNFVNEILEHDSQIKLWLFMRTLAGCYTAAVKLTESCQPYKIFTIISVEALLDDIFLDYKDSYITKEIQSLTTIFLEELSKNQQLRQQYQNDSKDAGTLISLEMALNFMHASEEAVKRCVLLSHKMELPQNLTKIFNTLLNYLCKKYVNVALSKAVTVLPEKCIGSYQRTIGMIENFFEMVYFVNQIVIFIQKHFHVDILPHIASSANDLTNCSNKKNTALAKLEDKIHEGLSKSLSSIMSSIGIILDAQRKKDPYRLAENASPTGSVTPTCSEVISFVKRIKGMFEKNLDGKNVDILLEEFGKKLYTLLLAHYKKFYVSPGLGGLVLLQDLTAYRDCAKLFNSEVVADKFEVLKEIAAIYNVAPENLKILFTDTKLAKLDKNDVMNFIKLRTDFKTIWVGKYI